MINQLLKEERIAAGLTQKQLAQKSGISFVAVNRIEKGQMPRLSVALKLFAAMGKGLNITTFPLAVDPVSNEVAETNS